MTDENPTDTTSPQMWKYLGWYVGVSLGINVVFVLLSMNLGVLSLLIPLIASMFAVNRFVKSEQRVPTRGETWWLIWASFGMSLIWAGMNFLLMYTTGVYGEAVGDGHLEFALWTAIVALVTFVLVWVAYTYWPARVYAAQSRRGG